jgi:hypothetical protein
MKRPVIAENGLPSEVEDAQNEPVILDLSKIQVGRLDRLEDVRREMAKVYRHVRTGKLPSQEGARLVYMLDRIARAIEGHELERRLSELERFYGG